MNDDIYVGSIFHKWKVIDATLIPTKNNYSKRVLCKCECGTEKLVEVRSLRNGHSKSCGCRKQDNAASNLANKIGKKFNLLTIISNGGKEHNYKWYCQCDCGNFIYVGFNELENEKIKSCGCLKRVSKEEKMRDLIGQTFGKILIIDIDNLEKRTVKYKCDCGTIKSCRYYDILSGNVISCGCIKSKGEFLVAKLLQKLGVEYQKEVSFPDCKDVNRLLFDFGLYKNNDLIGLIEYNGNIHYSSRGTGWNTPERLLRVQKHDYIKQLFCETRGIPFLIIPYTITDIENFLLTSDFYQIISKSLND